MENFYEVLSIHNLTSFSIKSLFVLLLSKTLEFIFKDKLRILSFIESIIPNLSFSKSLLAASTIAVAFDSASSNFCLVFFFDNSSALFCISNA